MTMKADFLDNWTTQIRKGLLELCILNALRKESLYGFDIVKKLRDIRGLVISEGTVYPLLSRLRRDGFVQTKLKESKEGPARKYYELTPKGQKILNEMNSYWQDVKTGADILSKEETL